MSRESSPEAFGRKVLGPIVAEFCLRLWTLGALFDHRPDVAMLFCARGGLRMQLAYEHFLAACELPSPMHVAPLMVSRVAAVRPALMRTVDEDLDALVPSAASNLSYEFGRSSLSDAAFAMSGAVPSSNSQTWEGQFTPDNFAALLRHADGKPVVDALAQQSVLFTRHVRKALGGRHHAVLVDTGLFGTTRQLLAEGIPNINFGSALIARSYRPGPTDLRAKTFGLLVDAEGYSPLRRRTALLRHWHFVEWLFEPELPSVRTFGEDEDGVLRSNLEIPGWRERVEPTPGSAFQGIVQYIDALPHGPAKQISTDSYRAWGELRRAVVWPDRDHGFALSVGTRSHDFGTEATWSAREWHGPIAALRGSTMWREGEIARSGSRLRLPLLTAIETSYSMRRLKRLVVRTGRPS